MINYAIDHYPRKRLHPLEVFFYRLAYHYFELPSYSLCSLSLVLDISLNQGSCVSISVLSSSAAGSGGWAELPLSSV